MHTSSHHSTHTRSHASTHTSSFTSTHTSIQNCTHTSNHTSTHHSTQNCTRTSNHTSNRCTALQSVSSLLRAAARRSRLVYKRFSASALVRGELRVTHCACGGYGA
uniref:Uncharacterized protein n=1 Tax=Knipowitschia caucasica TaxID=637954 RepID=A0AAV2JWG2_KNICA